MSYLDFERRLKLLAHIKKWLTITSLLYVLMQYVFGVDMCLPFFAILGSVIMTLCYVNWGTCTILDTR